MAKACAKGEREEKQYGTLETDKDVSPQFLNASNSETIHQCER